jgi:hydroxymethylglutaryl-CoA lyase
MRPMSELPNAEELEEIAGAAAPAAAEVSLGECLLSDAPAEVAAMPSEARLAHAAAAAEAGFRRIGVTSLRDPALDATFADAELLLRGIRHAPGLACQAVCPDLMAVRRALAAQDGGWGPEEVVLPIAATDAASQAAFGEDRAARWASLAEMADRARGRFVLAGRIAAAFAEGADPAAVLADGERLAELGITRIAIADDEGRATPARVRDLIGWLHGGLPTATFVARFGDRRGTAIANTIAAIEAGLTEAEVALGGAGGLCCAEDLAAALAAMGLGTGLDPARLHRAGLAVERAIGRRLHSRVLRLVEDA